VKTIGWKISENLLGYRVKQVSRHRQRTACISSVAKDDAKEKSARTNELDGLERSVVGLKNRRRIFANYFHCRERLRRSRRTVRQSTRHFEIKLIGEAPKAEAFGN